MERALEKFAVNVDTAAGWPHRLQPIKSKITQQSEPIKSAVMLVIKGGIINSDWDEALISEHLAFVASLTLRNELNGMPTTVDAKNELRPAARQFIHGLIFRALSSPSLKTAVTFSHLEQVMTDGLSMWSSFGLSTWGFAMSHSVNQRWLPQASLSVTEVFWKITSTEFLSASLSAEIACACRLQEVVCVEPCNQIGETTHDRGS